MRINRKKNKNKTYNNRINIVVAVIFLFVFSILFQLYSLQVVRHDLFIALASDQHNVTNILEPERGDILISETKEGGEEELYPVATNKEFAHIFTIPSEVKDASSAAHTLFTILDQEETYILVDEALEEDEYFLKIYEEDTPPEVKEELIELEK